jgi:hypothetical protein
MGHAVGAGTAMVSGELSSICERASAAMVVLLSATDDVDDEENGDPDDIHEVPIERHDIDASGMLLCDMSEEREERDGREREYASGDVERVQADK